MMQKQNVLYFRNFIFGVEDSLVSTVGLLSGIVIGGVPRNTIFLTGVVLILVEAFSMAAGSFLAESSAEEYLSTAAVDTKPFWGSIVMFFSYFIAGLIPLAPYMFVSTNGALYVSVGVSLLALFILGLVGGSLTHGKILSRGVRMMLIGGIAIIAGMLAGLTFGAT
jgi:VIT1/CCC1 family predicted Fe2+/Mn2+ transporter